MRRSTYNPSYSAQFSYYENNSIKISIDFTVPDHLVSKLIGKNGENVRGIMNKTGAVVNFSKEVSIKIYKILKNLYYSIMMKGGYTHKMALRGCAI